MRANHHKVHGEVTCEIGHGNISLHTPYARGDYDGRVGLPWAVLATLRVDFHFNGQRQRFKVLKARVQLGENEPEEHEVLAAKVRARWLLENELVAHGVTSVSASDLVLTDCGLTNWQPETTPGVDLWPF